MLFPLLCFEPGVNSCFNESAFEVRPRQHGSSTNMPQQQQQQQQPNLIQNEVEINFFRQREKTLFMVG